MFLDDYDKKRFRGRFNNIDLYLYSIVQYAILHIIYWVFRRFSKLVVEPKFQNLIFRIIRRGLNPKDYQKFSELWQFL